MNRKTAWISTACVVSVGLCALAGTVLGRERPAKVVASATPSPRTVTKRVIAWRVNDPTSPEYKQ
ncbi:MAG: hypothetical protein RL033_6421, partial [Pseudomonadota bacterium]